jgi:hypothetical protein
MTSKEVYKAMRSFVSNHDHKFENVYVHQWEADCFSVTSSNYSYEIEVKVSRSDFFADFKKPKHHFFKNIRDDHSILREEQSWIQYNNLRDAGHPHLIGLKIEYSNIKPLKVGQANCPNKFFFACPVGMIELTEVPTYAGLIYVFDSGGYRIIKKAPFLHKEELNIKTMLFQKYMNLSIEQKRTIWELQDEIVRLKNRLKNAMIDTPNN